MSHHATITMHNAPYIILKSATISYIYSITILVTFYDYGNGIVEFMNHVISISVHSAAS